MMWFDKMSMFAHSVSQLCLTNKISYIHGPCMDTNLPVAEAEREWLVLSVSCRQEMLGFFRSLPLQGLVPAGSTCLGPQVCGGRH